MPHIVDTHNNQDKVLKESFYLYKGGTLDFLDNALSGKVTEILSTEVTETTTKKAYADNALKMSDNTGLHHEWEAEIDIKDIKRFASYNIDMSRMHDIDFTTIIITTSKPRATSYTNPSLTFAPRIINLKDRDADGVLAEIDSKLKAGEPINELVLLYLPLYGSDSGKTTAELLDRAIKLTPQVAKDDKNKQQKLLSLLILLTSSFISNEEKNRVMEANMRILEDNPAIKWWEDRGIQKGIEKGIEQTAQNMLRRGRDIQEISEDTGLSIERITELQSSMLQHA